MKKILLGTTGLIAAAMFADAASAQTPKVTIGGVADFQAGFVSDDLDGAQRGHGFRNDTEISVRVDGRTDSGLEYGAVIDLEADVSEDRDNEGANASRTYVYLGGSFGRLELGSNTGAGEAMRVDASTLAAATGGIDGAWRFFANNIAGADFINVPSLPLGHGDVTRLGDESTDNASKITYYSPRYSGFQLGLSYQPDLDDRGQGVGTGTGDIFMGDNDSGEVGEIIDVALGYDNQFGEVALSAYANYQIGDAETAGNEDLSAYAVGFNLGYAGVTFGASYGEWDDAIIANADGDYYTLGLGYTHGAFGASVTWMDSTYEDGSLENEFQNLVVGADYQLAPGLTPYAEVSFYEFDSEVNATENDGTVFILGTQLSF